MSELQCGIDIGTTNVKVVLVGETGRSVWTKSVPTPRSVDGPGVATDAARLVSLLEDIVIEGWRAVGRGLPLRAIATAGVGEDGLGITADLTPTGLALPWFDPRAAPQARALRAQSHEAVRAGIAVDPSRTAAKWLWLRQNRGDVLDRAQHWVALTDYPAVVWSRSPFLSETLAVRTACYDIYTRTWIESLLAAAGAPPLPPVVPAGTAIGTVEFGPLRGSGAASAATVVVAGGHDHPIAASAIRRIDRRARINSMGTANLVYGEAAMPAAPKLDPYLAFSVPVGGGPGLACLGVFEFAAALASFRGPSDRLASALALPRIAGPTGVNPPLPTPEAMSGADIRPALEACAMYARRMFEAAADAGVPPGPIHATGGWARSGALLELRASVYGEAIVAVEEPELTAVGAALVAAEGAGVSLPFDGTGRRRTVEPAADWARTYRALYPSYRERLDAIIASRSADAEVPLNLPRTGTPRAQGAAKWP